MSERFVIADLHWGHPGVLSVPGRRERFAGCTILEHDETLIDNWNDTVTKRDMIYLLGDVGFDKPSGYLTKGILPRLNGNIKLIAGNHDNQAIIKAKRWAQVSAIETVSVRGYHLILTHIPMHPQEMYWDLNIHGHLHSNSVKRYACGPAAGHLNNQRDIRYQCVSVEHTNYAPVSLDSVVEDWLARGGKQVVISSVIGRERR